MNTIPKSPSCQVECPAAKQTTSPATDPNQLPEAVQIALGQIAHFLNDSGQEMLAKLMQQDDGYPQLVVMLEKLCKSALGWREPSSETPESGDVRSGKGGFSPETERQFEVKLEGA